MPDDQDDVALILGTVTIARVMTGDDLAVTVDAVTSDGDRLDLVESLGMLELGKAALLEDHAEDEGEVR